MSRKRSHPEPAKTGEPIAIRSEYERRGVEAFYRSAGDRYRNPHEPQVRVLLRRACELWWPDLTRVLDLSAGSGEATLVLRELGAREIVGADPFTYAAYESRTGQRAQRWSFDDIAAGALARDSFTLVVCSFALHLCLKSRLPAVTMQLAMAADRLLVLTPHKRPVLAARWGWRSEGEILEQRVRARLYGSEHRGQNPAGGGEKGEIILA